LIIATPSLKLGATPALNITVSTRMTMLQLWQQRGPPRLMP
jgi:hypothetical protein